MEQPSPQRQRIALNWEQALYIVLIVLALLTRLWGLGDRVQSHDESIHSRYSWNLATGRGFAHDPMMHGPSLFHIAALSFFLFGDNDFTARLPIALAGVALVAFPYLLRRWLGRAGALATSFLLLISPAIAYYSRYIRHDILIIVCQALVAWALLEYLHAGHARHLYWMAAGVGLGFATMETAFIYNAIFGVFLVGLFIVRAFHLRWSHERLRPAFLFALGAALLYGGLLALAFRERPEGGGKLPWWGLECGIIAGLALVAAAVLLLKGVWCYLRPGRMDGSAGAYKPALGRVADLIVVLLTLCLPFLSPLPISLAGLDPVDYTAPTLYYSAGIVSAVFALSAALGLAWNWRRWGVAAAIHYAIVVVLYTTFFTNGWGIGSGLVGSLGYWLAQQGVQRGGQPPYYYVVTVLFYEYLPLLLALSAVVLLVVRGIRRSRAERRAARAAAVGSATVPAGQEAAEHEVPDAAPGEVLEAAPGGIPEAASGGVLDAAPAAAKDAAPAAALVPFLPFVLWWAVLAWLAFSVAGERMPWLTVHVTLPMILLSGWLVGQLIEGLDWRRLAERRAWWLALLAVTFAVALAYLVQTLGLGPFGGYDLERLRAKGRLVGALALSLALGAVLVHRAVQSGWRAVLGVAALLALLTGAGQTVRTAWRFCFVNYDFPTELLVYAHGAPGVNEVMQRVDAISRRTAGGRYEVRLGYCAEGSTFWYWQMRHYHNAVYLGKAPTRESLDLPVIIAGEEEWNVIEPYLGDAYSVTTMPYLWWPIEDYRNLTAERIWKALTDRETRAALWDLWAHRDYGRYSALTGKTLTLEEWPFPYRKDVRLYVRNDVAARMWEQSTYTPTGDLAALGEMPSPTPDPYGAGWVDLAPRLVFGSQGSEPGQLQAPRDLAVSTEGYTYVVDSTNHRVTEFAPDGTYVASWGQHSLAENEGGAVQGFNEPWGIAAGADGTLYVADTWNQRIQKISPQGEVLLTWNRFTDAAGTLGGFYGPRDLVVVGERLYVTDTGNKTVRVFDLDGQSLFSWGGGGIMEGYLDEPVGIAAGPGPGCTDAGCIYVADTWNRRVQVFDAEGRYLRQWPIAGWDDPSIENKPYLAVDAQGSVYVTDPFHYRVLVFDSVGTYLYSFGQYGFDERSFALPTGIAVGPDGAVYVADAHSGRVLVYDVAGSPEE